MNEIEKAKLKVLIKSILIHNYPKEMTAKQISDIINDYEWGFNISITSKLISKLILVELKKGNKNFMQNVKSTKTNNTYKYSISIFQR